MVCAVPPLWLEYQAVDEVACIALEKNASIDDRGLDGPASVELSHFVGVLGEAGPVPVCALLLIEHTLDGFSNVRI